MFVFGWLWFYIKHVFRLARQSFQNGYAAACKRKGFELTPVGTLSLDAREIRDKVVAYLGSVKDKSEITIRHDAELLRKELMGK